MLRTMLAAIIAVYCVFPVSAFELTGQTRQVGPEVSSVPFWDQVVVQQGDTLARVCTAFLQGKELPFTVDQCVGGITTINPELVDNPGLIRVGQLIWVPSERNTREAVLAQLENRQQLATIVGNPLTLAAMVGTVSDRIAAVEEQQIIDGRNIADVQATADDAREAARIAAESAAANTVAVEDLTVRTSGAERAIETVGYELDVLAGNVVADRAANAARFDDIDARLAEQGNQLADKADATVVESRFNEVEGDLSVFGFPLKTVGAIVATILLSLLAGGFFTLRRQIGGVKKTADKALNLAHEAKAVADQAMVRADLALSMMFDGVKFIGDVPTQAHFDALDEGQYQPITISVGGQTANLKLCREGDKFFLLGTTSRERVPVKDAKSLTGTLSKHCAKANREGFATAFTPHLRAA